MRIGDAVFDYSPRKRKYQLHVGIARDRAEPNPALKLRVMGLPDRPKSDLFGEATWGEPKQYKPCLLGQRVAASDAQLMAVALLAEAVSRGHSQLATRCRWDAKLVIQETRRVAGLAPLFVSGTCSHFVEYLYQHSGLDLVDEARTHKASEPGRLHPATQIHAFWTGQYPLSVAWDDRLASYDACLFGERVTKS